MNCPRCGSFVFREADPYGGTEFLCISGHSWMERVGVPITEDPMYNKRVREGHTTTRPADEQELSYQLRLAQQRVRDTQARMKRRMRALG